MAMWSCRRQWFTLIYRRKWWPAFPTAYLWSWCVYFLLDANSLVGSSVTSLMSLWPSRVALLHHWCPSLTVTGPPTPSVMFLWSSRATTLSVMSLWPSRVALRHHWCSSDRQWRNTSGRCTQTRLIDPGASRSQAIWFEYMWSCSHTITVHELVFQAGYRFRLWCLGNSLFQEKKRVISVKNVKNTWRHSCNEFRFLCNFAKTMPGKTF